MLNKTTVWLLLLALLTIWASTLHSAPLPEKSEQQQARGDITSIKKEVLLLDRDLSILEQEILYPLMSQFSVYLSAADKPPFKSGAITLKIDGQTVADQRFSATTIAALFNDTVQRLYIGALTPGEHTLQLIYSWQGQEIKPIKGEIIHTFKKRNQAKLIELTLVKQASSKTPLFNILEWE